jgi:hypothetical protein
MATTRSTTPEPSDQTLPQILAALQAIADAVNRGTEVLVDPSDDRAASQEQSTTIVDYLVLRELVGRQFDGLRRTVGATRFSGQRVEFDGDIPATATKVAVFTRRSVAPDEVVQIVDLSSVDARKRRRTRTAGSTAGDDSSSGSSGDGGGDDDPQLGFELDVVTDDQPIVRLELRDDADLAVALGPRLASVA